VVPNIIDLVTLYYDKNRAITQSKKPRSHQQPRWFNLNREIIEKNSFSHKLRYERYLELICWCLSDDMYIKLIHMRIPYEKITCLYEKTYVMVV
jgi:hypothetical protein